MERALVLAAHAATRGEVPVGAVLVRDDTVLAEGWNRPISDADPTAHAEMVALRGAARRIGNYRLTGTTLYVTLEPCPMCAGALVHARIERLVYGASDERWGGCGSVLNVLAPGARNHTVQVTRAVQAQRSQALLQQFFRQKRLP